MEAVEQSLVRIESLINAMDQKIDRRFDGVNRFLLTILVAMIGGLLGVIAKLV